MTQEAKEMYLKEYVGKNPEELQSEKARLEQEIKEQTAIWKTTGFGGWIVMVVLGIPLMAILVGFVLVPIGIVRIVKNSRLRNRANIAIWHARDRIQVIDELLRNGRKPEVVEGEIVG